MLGLALLGLLLAVIDLDTRRLPDLLTLPAYPAVLALLATASLLTGDWPALGFLCGAATGVALVLSGRASLRSAIPFGPAMLTGALAAALYGDHLAALYLSW